MSDYLEAFQRLADIGRRPYVVNEKDPNRGYERRWKIHIPPGPNNDPIELHDCIDDDQTRDRLLEAIADRLAPAEAVE